MILSNCITTLWVWSCPLQRGGPRLQSPMPGFNFSQAARGPVQLCWGGAVQKVQKFSWHKTVSTLWDGQKGGAIQTVGETVFLGFLPRPFSPPCPLDGVPIAPLEPLVGVAGPPIAKSRLVCFKNISWSYNKNWNRYYCFIGKKSQDCAGSQGISTISLELHYIPWVRR